MEYYASSCLKEFSKEERIQLVSLHGERDQYDIIPDFNFQNSLHSYPVVNPFQLEIDVHQHPQVLQALLKYAENTETFRFNMCLNLLNKVSNAQLFKFLLLGCLGSPHDSVPDVVFRKSKLSDVEMEEMRKNVGKNYLSRSFMSTSAVPQNQFEGILFKINLERGTRNGAIDLRKLDTRFSEQEILLCGYSVFRIDNCSSNLIELTYLDYYQFENWKEGGGVGSGVGGGMGEKEDEAMLVQRFRVKFGGVFEGEQENVLDKLQVQLDALGKSGGGGSGGGRGGGSSVGERDDLFRATSLY